jgi:hypothetical protein
MLTEHYQSIIRDEYVPLVAGFDRAEAIKRHGFFLYRPDTASGTARPPGCTDDSAPLPHEFSAAAFWFGHSQIRNGYQLNTGPGGAGGFGSLFGSQRLKAETRIDFSRFFRIPGTDAPQDSLLIDTVVSQPLASLAIPSIPQSDIDKGLPLISLANRNAVRVTPISSEANQLNTQHMPNRFPVPSGPAVAAEILKRGIPELTFVPLTQDQLASTKMAQPGKVSGALGGVAPKIEELPLWVYILAEAEAFNGGSVLGPVGGMLVGEVMLGLLTCDDAGIMRDPFWRPTLPSAAIGRFGFGDLVRIVEGS